MSDFLFPSLEEEHGPLSKNLRKFVTVCELAQLDKHMARYAGARLGRSKLARVAFAKAFCAKAVLNVATTKDLVERLRCDAPLRRLCGWEWTCQVPSESTFSRAFAEFAAGGLGEQVHAAMVSEHLGDRLVFHESIDATAIHAREKSAPKETREAKTPKPRRKRGRPKKGEERPAPEPKRLDLQPGRTLKENLDDLPRECDWGRKKNSQGKIEQWKGYKIHLAVADGGIPIAATLTSASVHDSQVAIPLMQMSVERATVLYDLLDAAYDAEAIHKYSRGLGRRPLIDANPRGGGEKIPMAPAEARRFRERTTVERCNAELKDNHGGRFVRVRGAAKVGLHLMFGVIAITGLQLARLAEPLIE
jgi:hypothetical protein